MSMSKTFSKQIDKKIDVSCSSTFCFISFPGVPQRWEFKSATKNVLHTARVEKFLPKKSTKIQNRLQLSRFFYHSFWAFFGEGSLKTPFKTSFCFGRSFFGL
jgi:hypothetical protein